MSDEIIDRETLQSIKDIAGEQADELLKDLIRSYLDDAPQSLQQIKEAITQNNPTKLEVSAHALRSISLNLGAINFAEMCQSLELLGRTGKVEEATKLLTLLSEKFEQVITTLKQDYLEP